MGKYFSLFYLEDSGRERGGKRESESKESRRGESARERKRNVFCPLLSFPDGDCAELDQADSRRQTSESSMHIAGTQALGSPCTVLTDGLAES